jgi:hypothetical protein
MSFPSDVVNALTSLWQRSLVDNQRPSFLLPLEAKTISPEDNVTLTLDSNMFNESNMITYNLLGQDIPLYNTQTGFGYDVSETTGAFFLLGEPGLFDFGFNRMSVTDSNDNFLPPDLITSTLLYFDMNEDIGGYPTPYNMTGTQHAQVYMNSNSAIIFAPNFYSNNIDTYKITPSNQLVISRLTRNSY